MLRVLEFCDTDSVQAVITHEQLFSLVNACPNRERIIRKLGRTLRESSKFTRKAKAQNSFMMRCSR